MKSPQEYIMGKIQETVAEMDVGAGKIEGQPRHILQKSNWANTGFLIFMQGNKTVKIVYYDFQDSARFTEQKDTHTRGHLNNNTWNIEYDKLDRRAFRVPDSNKRLHLDGGVPAFQRVIRSWYNNVR